MKSASISLVTFVLLIAIADAPLLHAGFLAGTLVRTMHGYAPIEQLQVGDQVLCSTMYGTDVARPVTRVLQIPLVRYLCIRSGNQVVNVSADQKLYVPDDNRWRQADQLALYDRLLAGDASRAIDSIDSVQHDAVSYDIVVADYHNFYVSTHNILVHNFAPIVSIAATWLIGEGIEFAGISVAATLWGIALGCALCRNSTRGADDNGYTVRPIIDYQPTEYSDITHNPLVIRDDGEYAPIYPLYIDERYGSGTAPVIEARSEYGKEKARTRNGARAVGGMPQNPDDDFNDFNHRRNNEKIRPHGKYEDASYHHQNSSGRKGKAPIDGQDALDNSIPIDESDRRIAVSCQQIVVLAKTSDGLYHGHVRTWDELTEAMKTALRIAGLVTPKGKIIRR